MGAGGGRVKIALVSKLMKAAWYVAFLLLIIHKMEKNRKSEFISFVVKRQGVIRLATAHTHEEPP